MITVMELLSIPIFKDFKLVTDRSGLYNRVRNSKVFEWQTGKTIDSSFTPGDFVITTLSPYKDFPDSVEPILLTLLKKNLSALCIRDVYFNRISEKVISYANEINTPIFFFSETPTDDIIFAVKSTLTPDKINLQAVQNARKILYSNLNNFEIETLAKEINPYFNKNIICGFWVPRNQKKSNELLDEYATNYKNIISSIDLPADIAYSFVRFSNGLAIFYTDVKGPEDLRSGLIELGKKLEINNNLFAMGISKSYTQLNKLNMVLQESIYAGLSSLMEKTHSSDFDDIGIMRILLPLRNDYWMKQYYDEILSTIINYDKNHHSNLLNTLLEYIHANGDINKTAEKTFQHSNTIRYRIDKLKEILKIDTFSAKSQLYIIAKLYEINLFLSDFTI